MLTNLIALGLLLISPGSTSATSSQPPPDISIDQHVDGLAEEFAKLMAKTSADHNDVETASDILHRAVATAGTHSGHANPGQHRIILAGLILGGLTLGVIDLHQEHLLALTGGLMTLGFFSGMSRTFDLEQLQRDRVKAKREVADRFWSRVEAHYRDLASLQVADVARASDLIAHVGQHPLVRGQQWIEGCTLWLTKLPGKLDQEG